MIEYSRPQKIELLLGELRRCPVDINSPNVVVDYKSFFSQTILNISNEIKDILLEYEYIIVRNFSSCANDAISLARLLSDKIFYQGKTLKFIYQFQTQPFQTEILSTSLNCGAFHTDFWSVEDTPNYFMLQCIETDPKHPFYSRNQVVLVSLILETLERLAPGITQMLLECKLPHQIADNKIIWVKLLDSCQGKLMIRLHPEYVAEYALKSEHYIDNIPIHHLISDVAQSIADDFVLGRGDVLIASNKFCLHRRGEATVSFQSNLSQWKGRKVNTLRFF